MKYMTTDWAIMGGILKILSRAYLKYCRLIRTDCISQLQLPATNTAYLFGFREPLKINYYMSKISLGKPWNLANWPVEFGKICHGNLWSL